MRLSKKTRAGPRWTVAWIVAVLVLSLVRVDHTAWLMAAKPGQPVQQRPPTLPDPPPLILPPDGSHTCTPAPLFSWGRVKQASFYRIQVGDDPSLGSPIFDQSVDQTSFVPDSDLPGGTWYWRVRAANDQLTGSWAAPWSVTILQPPAAPVLLSPTEDGQVCDRTPTLAWSTVDDATSYRVQVDDDPGFGSPALDVIASDSTYTPSTELAPGAYSWRVQARNACGDSSWSPVLSFVVLARPAVPTLLTPPDGISTKERAPTFSWSGVSGAAFYRIQVDDGLQFGSPIIDQKVATVSFVPTNGLLNGTYYWRVRAGTACESGDWSDPWSVTVRNDAPIAADDRFQVDEDSPDSQLDVLANDLDPDGDTLHITRVTQPRYGSASIAVTRDRLIYRPDPDYFGQDSLTYTIDDGYGSVDTARVELTVIGINDPPVADAGPDQSVPTSALVTLDGTHSSDPDGNLPLSYFWTQSGGPPVALSSGIAAAPTFIAPDVSSTLTFELLVMDALGEAGVAPDQTVITVYSPTIHHFYLPALMRGYVVAPDLVVQRIDATQSGLRIVIANQGNAPVKDGFFVDLYIDPRSAPETVNQTWDQLGTQGMVWGVTGLALASLVPGGSVTLEVGDLYFMPDLSSYSGSMPAGTILYAQVDSYSPTTSFGTVLEGHEIAGGAYNNVHGPVHSTATVSVGGMPLARPGPHLR